MFKLDPWECLPRAVWIVPSGGIQLCGRFLLHKALTGCYNSSQLQDGESYEFFTNRESRIIIYILSKVNSIGVYLLLASCYAFLSSGPMHAVTQPIPGCNHASMWHIWISCFMSWMTPRTLMWETRGTLWLLGLRSTWPSIGHSAEANNLTRSEVLLWLSANPC